MSLALDPMVLLFISLTAAIAIVFGAAASLLVGDARRSRQRVRDLEAELERQGDLIWELRESEERARSLIDGQGDLIVRRDLTGRLVYANDAFVALTGKPREDLLGRPVALEVVRRQEGPSRPDGIGCRDEAIRTPSGLVWIEWREVAVRGFSGQVEIQSVGRDISARRESETAASRARAEAEAASRAKSRFLATVSHEIRTPLGGMLGMADLLLESNLTPAQVTYAKAIKTSGEALLSLIDEILDFSRIESGRLELDEKPFSPRALIEDVVELLSPRAHAKAIDIAARIAPAVPDQVLGDAGRVKQVILNLAGNALKFTEKGGVTLRVSMRDNRIAFTVADTGIGIPRDQLDRIFGEFEQVEAGPSRRFGGTGLGLAISQRIVTRMGGAIGVESRPGEGSTFSFSLALPVQTRAPAPPPEARGRRVLVASPSAITGPVIAAMLMDVNAAVTLEKDGARAREIAAADSFDAILADRAFGLDACCAIASAGLAAGNRVVALVTPGERHEIGRLSSAGAAAWLIKPIRSASLIAQIAGRSGTRGPSDDATDTVERPLRGLATLLAEDNEVNALVARTVLMKLGASVAWAKDGVEAVRLHADGRFDVVLMDLQMPGLDGLAAARAIREQETRAGAERKPIFALTASASAEDREACLAAGMDECLTKPVDRDALVARLRPLVRRSGRRRTKSTPALPMVRASSA